MAGFYRPQKNRAGAIGSPGSNNWLIGARRKMPDYHRTVTNYEYRKIPSVSSP